MEWDSTYAAGIACLRKPTIADVGQKKETIKSDEQQRTKNIWCSQMGHIQTTKWRIPTEKDDHIQGNA